MAAIAVRNRGAVFSVRPLMGAPEDRGRRLEAASFFLARAHEATEAAERARSEPAAEALYKEAETWLYIASRCLNPDREPRRPGSLTSGPRRVDGEPRSFRAEE